MNWLDAPAVLGTWPAPAAIRVYGDLAWTLVVAAGLVHLAPQRWTGTGWRAAGAVAGAIAISAALLLAVGRGAGAQALGLALQQPSGLLTALAAVSLWRRGSSFRDAAPGRVPVAATWPVAWAMAWVVAGLVLYADALGYLAMDLYPLGMPTRESAPWAALSIGLAALLGWRRLAWRPAVMAVALALALYAVARLPTGNLWDVFIDPLLWIACCFSVVRAALRRLRRLR